MKFELFKPYVKEDKMQIENLICVVSWHEKKFWQADVFERENNESAPIWYCTGDSKENVFGVINTTNKAYPGVKFQLGLSVSCSECGEEFIFQEYRYKCGGEIESF